MQLGKGNVCNELIAEYNAAGTLLKRYVHGIGSDDPLVSYDGAGTASPTYLLADERGSIMAETNSAGTVTTKHQYGPYGEPINQSASRFRYTGQILLPGTALYHYKARVYHPKLGRFLQTDPIGYKDGMNWYAYVGNDPMNAVDPSGMSTLNIWFENHSDDNGLPFSALGHVSLYTNDGVYISHFPDMDNNRMSVFRTFAQDIALYKRVPDVVFNIELPDERAATDEALRIMGEKAGKVKWGS